MTIYEAQEDVADARQSLERINDAIKKLETERVFACRRLDTAKSRWDTLQRIARQKSKRTPVVKLKSYDDDELYGRQKSKGRKGK